jgi:hypothetical protein
MDGVNFATSPDSPLPERQLPILDLFLCNEDTDLGVTTTTVE